MSVSYGGDKITFDDGTSIASGLSHFRNRIINGAMEIDQRNNGAAVSVDGVNAYGVDRWTSTEIGNGALTQQQISDAPPGFKNSLRITTTTAQTGTLNAVTRQYIEGTNLVDLAWGTASAKAVTLSFWVKSSLTGTFGGTIKNEDGSRNYPFSYTISSANTWEYETITIPGDTTGTWLTTTGIGIIVWFSHGASDATLGSMGSWTATDRRGVTGQTSIIATLNATWQITGVQLETGSYATTFERRPFGTELQLCQRYYEKSYAIGTVPGTATSVGQMQGIRGNGMFVSRVVFKVTKRTTPGTIVAYSSTTGTSAKVNNANSGSDENASINDASDAGMMISGTTSSISDTYRYHWTADAEL